MRRATDDELESYLDEAVAGTRSELDVEQIAPFAQRGAAYVPIARGHEEEVKVDLAALAEDLRYFLAVEETDRARALEPDFFDALAPGIVALKIGHASDRTYAGYGPIVKELRALARFLEPARWTIAESQGDWIDDFTCDGRQLRIRRWYGTEDADSPAAALEDMAAADDAELAAHARLDRVRDAASFVFEAFHSTGAIRQSRVDAARRELDRAGTIPVAMAERALLALVLDDGAEAQRLARSALEHEDVPLARFVAALVSFSEDREDDARAHAVAALARAPWSAEARLLAMGSSSDDEHARSLLTLADARWSAYPGHMGGPWDRLRLALLVRARRSERLDARLLSTIDGPTDTPKGAALLLFTYGEALRLAGAPSRARALYERAASFDALNGEIEKRGVRLREV